MSDIAERLKKCVELFKELNPTVQPFEALEVESELLTIIAEHHDAIISAQQFAEDMQRLTEGNCHLMPEFSRTSGGLVKLNLSMGRENGNFYGPDIFTAARNAVEQMEGK